REAHPVKLGGEMGSSYKRLALVGAAIAALIISAALLGATSSASAAKQSRSPSMGARATAKSLRAVRGLHLKAPKAPNVVLYDQYDNPGTFATSSQNFESDFDAFDDMLADDFVVPGGDTWQVNQVDVMGLYFNGPGVMNSANVNFYSDASGLPGS